MFLTHLRRQPVLGATAAMQVSGGAKACLPNATAHAHIRSLGVVEA